MGKFSNPGGHAPGTVDVTLPTVLRTLVRAKRNVAQGNIIGVSPFGGDLLILLKGLASTAVRHEDGARQIYSFHHGGDFLGLHVFMNLDSSEQIEIQALADCCLGMINGKLLEQEMLRVPALGQLLWRAATNEARIYRRRLIFLRWPAQQRVAYLLYEQMRRLSTGDRVIPLSQMDVADAVALSAVHTNRVIQELRTLGALSSKRQIEVANENRLRELASVHEDDVEANDWSGWNLRME